MKNKNRRLISCLLSAILLLVMSFGFGTFAGAEESDSSKPVVWIVGDSTVSAFTDNYYYPRYGWGTQIDKYLDGTFEVKNIALSGRSSTSYTADKEYGELIAGMKKGDFLLVGFGHNDEKAESGRYTNPNGDYKTAGSFAYSLYENYIKPAQAAGTTVVLCTPIVRRTADGNWSDSQLHVTAASGEFEGGSYPQAIINLGKDLNVPVVDMTSLTKELYDSLGAAETVNLHAWTSSKPESVDNTHTNIWGGTYNAYLVTKTIKELNVAGLAEHIIDAKAPTKSDVLKSNPDYKESEYSNDLKDSELWANAGIFKGTVFGNVGGNDKIASKFKLESLDNGNINIAVNGAGKIASTADGIAMYYYRVPANSNFTITAKATVNSFTSNDQVSFGLMARDDMYVDQYINSTMGDYVAAGPLKLTKKDSVWNCFARKSGALTQGGTCANEIKAGETYNLKIESNTDGYACTFGNEETITGGFDFKLTSVDSEYVYVGMYVARSADVTFSDVKLVVDGKEITSAGEPENPTPGEPENPTPGEPENPTPGEPENPAPGEPENPTPGEPENPAPEQPAKPETPAEQPATDPVVSDNNGVETGDSYHMVWYIAAMTLTAGIACVELKRKKTFDK
ncbi:MAG: carbohydrate esterase family 12 protein [Lachnospira sp.]|nr:carbohydrate esterase family 12 protein [Lachnospira sp.]